jgi:hypothetical protein
MKVVPLLLAIALFSPLHAQEPPPAPDRNRPGPWDNDVLVYRVAPAGEPEKLATFERAGVPTVARLRDGRLLAAHQHFPENDRPNFDKVAVRFSPDEGRTWTAPQVIRVSGLPEGMRFPFDPTLVPLPDGRLRLYFTGNYGRTFQRSTPAIHSAISKDGVDYTYEPGVRFSVEGRVVIDCAVALHEGVFHLIVPDNGEAEEFLRPPSPVGGEGRDEGAGRPVRPPPRREPPGGNGYHALSRDGLKFERVADVKLPSSRNRWLGNLASDAGRLVFFGSGPGTWPVTSTDGKNWQPAESATRIPGADPGAVKLRDGSWLLLVTGEPRPGTPSARQRGDRPSRPPGETTSQPGGQRFGDFGEQALPPGDGGPRHHRILLASSKDGLSWTLAQESLAEQASVPELFEGPDGRLVVLFVDASGQSPRGALGAMVRAEDGTWTRAETNLRGADPNVVRLKDGAYRAYTKEPDGSIIVFSSRDGLRWERLGVAFQSDRYRQATDADVFETPDGWVMLISLGPRLLRCTSRDGLTFTTDGTILDLGGSVSDTVVVPGGWRTYFHVNASPRTGGKMRIRSAFTADGRTWKTEEGDRILAPTGGPAQFGVADPAPVQLRDGTWLMAIKSFRQAPVSKATPGRNTDSPVPGGRERPADRFEPPPQGIEPGAVAPDGTPFPPRGESGGVLREIRVERVDSKYKTAPGAKPGTFVTGQDADLMLGGFGFNQSGGALVFNHPTGLATDGKALLMTDRWNNRVLIWKSAPASNAPSDLVLGQPDFNQNNPGKGRHQMNWPGNVAVTPDGQRIAVTDTSNDRILIWSSFPTKNGQAADLVLDLLQFSPPSAAPNQQSSPDARRPRFGGGMRFGWPWGVWTDGKKLAVVATHGSAVLMWNSLPTRDNQPPEFVLRPDGAGTPRNVTSDGKTFFAVSDHNYGDNSRPATMVWNSFPTSAPQPPDWTWREWVKGSFTPSGGLALAGIQSVYLFNKPPRDAATDADVVLRPATYRNGDGPDAVVAHGRLYVCTYNGNHILGWNSLPTRDHQPPDFALGSGRTDQDTWAENFFIQNPVVATDGKSLFVTSDFDRKMFVWRKLPDENAAKPDLVFHLPEGPWDNELHGSTLALAGRSTVYVWKKLPLDGEPPDLVLARRIGRVELGELTGVAFDEKYFYLSDRRSESIYVWEGIPSQQSEPKFTLAMRSPGRLTSDGNYLCAAPFEGSSIQLWRVSELSSRAEPITIGGRGQFNLPSECLIADGRLFVCNRSFNRVDVWDSVEDALAGRRTDALLGAADEHDRAPAIGRNKLFMPGSLAWGGGYLWVGEFKFSTRILRFSPQTKTN